MGVRKDQTILPVLNRILEIEDARPLYSQPETQLLGTRSETRIAEEVKPFQIIFPYPSDDETKEAWKTRGRVKQAVLFCAI
jgi:hypothetical protein